MPSDYIIGVVGNPNCGKTTLFNRLTGARQHVGNWPGVTVERKSGHFNHDDFRFELVDLPGTYSLDVVAEAVSLDEQIARNYVASRKADLIINIVDASNIERNLYLTSQLIEMRVPMLVVLNMMDVAEERKIRIDQGGLARRLGCPVVAITATRKKGVDALKRALLSAAQSKPIPTATVDYEAGLEQGIERQLPQLDAVAHSRQCDARWLALKLLEEDTLAEEIAGDVLVQLAATEKQMVETALGDDLDIIAADGRYGFVNTLTHECVARSSEVTRSRSDKIDRVVLNRALGIPIFLLVIYLMFMFTINIGSAFIDFFDIMVGAVMVDWIGEVMSAVGAPSWLTVLIQGIGSGFQVVATFIPIIGCLYLFLSVLEDSGYMARAAFVMDRFMRFIGLPGRAFVPMIVGFGCNVPAIMATRTMEHRRDRILTILMNPFMSCGARLPVYALFAAAFFPVGGQNLVFLLYLTGISAAVVTGLIIKRTLVPGDVTPFVMELPTYHLPTVKSVLLHTWDRLKSFLFRAGKVIVPMVLVLNLLNSVGTDGSMGEIESDETVLSAIGRTIIPAFSPMGLKEDNWPAAVGIFTGVLAKEAVVGTLDALYSQLAQRGGKSDSSDVAKVFSLRQSFQEALMTIPENLADVADNFLDPLGLNIGRVDDSSEAAEEQEVTVSTFVEMRRRFDGQAGAFAYMLFILLYFPCVAATAAIYRETSAGWATFAAGWTTGLAYMVATIFYQGATYARHPLTSSLWIGGLAGLFALIVAALKLWGLHQSSSHGVIATEFS